MGNRLWLVDVIKDSGVRKRLGIVENRNNGMMGLETESDDQVFFD